MRAPRLAALAAVMVLAIAASARMASAQSAEPQPARNVVLLHDARADAASWTKVIPLLEGAGLHVAAVETPQTSLEASAAETRRVLALQEGPVVLVGHGGTGAVVSETGADAKVEALVYLAAVAPEAGEDFAALSARFAVPQPAVAALASAKIEIAAWRDKPTFYAVSKQDAGMPTELQRFYAARMNAKTIVLDGDALPASHVREIAGLILEAAGRRPPACGADGDDGIAACAAPALPRSLMKGCKCTKGSLEDLTKP